MGGLISRVSSRTYRSARSDLSYQALTKPSPKVKNNTMDDQDSNKQHQNELEQIEDDDLIRSDEESDSSDEELEENSDMSDNELQDQLDNDESSSKRKRIYIPGQKLPKGTVLVPDESAYVMRHEFGLDSFPAYSFDYIYTHPDSANTNYPMTCHIAAGTSAGRGNKNHLIFAKISNVTKHDDEKDSSDEDSEDEDGTDHTPVFAKAEIKFKGGINKVRNLGNFTAVFGENKTVAIYDNSKAVEALNDVVKKRAWMHKQIKQKKDPLTPAQTFKHLDEGYALNWNQNNKKLLSADNRGQIHVWETNDTNWTINQTPYLGHTASVEDINWQPKSDFTFCSVSSDRSIQVFDTRHGYKPVVSVPDAHDNDINVMSWSSVDTNFIVTGGDDCAIKLWDTRNIQKGDKKHFAAVKHHSKPITSIEWHPTEDGVFAASGEDDQVTIWDFGVETEAVDKDLGADIPQQLLFIHAGHQNYKEVRWDHQKPGVLMTTSASEYCFDVFRTVSV